MSACGRNKYLDPDWLSCLHIVPVQLWPHLHIDTDIYRPFFYLNALSKPLMWDTAFERRGSMHALGLPLQGSFAKGSIQVLHEASAAPAPWIEFAAPSMHITLQNNNSGLSAPRESSL